MESTADGSAFHTYMQNAAKAAASVAAATWLELPPNTSDLLFKINIGNTTIRHAGTAIRNADFRYLDIASVITNILKGSVIGCISRTTDFRSISSLLQINWGL